MPRLTLAAAPVLCGVAVVENGYREPAAIEVVPPTYDAFLAADQRLLLLAQRHLARLPFAHLDLLIVDELGKTESGTGMDLNVIGSWRVAGGERRPDFRRIVALSLTPPSLGNALGIGLADLTTERLRREVDAAATWINLLTACEPGAMTTREGCLPLALPCDRDAVEVALASAVPSGPPRVCRIRSTADLAEFAVSPALVPEVANRPGFAVVGAPAFLPFDDHGDLPLEVTHAAYAPT